MDWIIIVVAVLAFVFFTSGFVYTYIKYIQPTKKITANQGMLVVGGRSKDQPTLVVNSRRELDTEVNRLLADGWKPAIYRPQFYWTPEDFANLRATVLKRGDEVRFIRVKDVPLDLWSQIMITDLSLRGVRRFVLGVIIAMIFIIILLTILTLAQR